MVQQGQIDHLLQETGEIQPPESLVQQAFLQDFDGAYRDSMASPEGFWEDVASELEWMRRWDTVFEWDYPTFRWFIGAKCNITQNALDRHLTNGNRNKAAFIWLGEDGSERVFTYGRLAQLVNRFANGLRSLGVGKGDRVVIYMPLTPEGAIAMLACARIGAVHSVVYAGFSSGSLRDRIVDAQAKVVVTADVGYRRGNEVDLLGITERAVADLDVVEKVILWRRKSHPHPNPPPEGEGTSSLGAREVDFDALMAAGSVDCDAEEMDSEDPLYILYTSGTTGKPKGVQHVHGGYMVGTYYHFKNFWDVKDQDVFWCMSDIGWVVGHSYIVYAPLVAGATTVFREGAIDYPQPGTFYEIIEKYGVNVLFTAPTALRMLMRYGEGYAKQHDLRSLRFLTCAGEPLNPEALRWSYEHICGNGEWGHIVDNWWQTETGGPCLGTTATMPVRPGRVGRPLPGAEMDIVDREGQPITEPDKGGLLVIKRPFPHFFRTVFGDPERYAQRLEHHPRRVLHRRRGPARRRWLLHGGGPRRRRAERGRAPHRLGGGGERAGVAPVGGRGGGHRQARRAARREHQGLRDPAGGQRPIGGDGRRPQAARPQRAGADRRAVGDRLHGDAAQDPQRQDHAPPAQGAGAGPRPRRHYDAGGVGNSAAAPVQFPLPPGEG